MSFLLKRYFLLMGVSMALVISCVDPLDLTLRENVDVIVVEGRITNLDEPQVIKLNRSKSDSLTGRFGTLPLVGATVEIIVDSSQVITLRETDAGRYQDPNGFVGQVGQTYQLKFTLKDGTRYESDPEIMLPVPPIQKVYERFNVTSLTPGLLGDSQYRSANDVYIDWQDPANQHNYYRWDWKLWETQEYCKTCVSGWYIIYDFSGQHLVEDCFAARPESQTGYFINDYACRSTCWAILRNDDVNVFDDQYSNGGLVTRRRIAQIPYYQTRGCLVEIRQSSLTRKAYQYNKVDQSQTQNNGGLTDSPPTATIGNVKNMANPQETVVGYFTVSAVSAARLWISRKENTGPRPGLFYALNNRQASPENLPFDPNTGKVKPEAPFPKNGRPPTAPCIDGDNSTPNKPLGWQD